MIAVSIILLILALAFLLCMGIALTDDEGGVAFFLFLLTGACVVGAIVIWPDDSTPAAAPVVAAQEFCIGSPEAVTFCKTPGNVSERILKFYKTFPEATAAEAQLKDKLAAYIESLKPVELIPPPLPSMNSYDAQVRRSDSILNAKLATP